MASDPTLRWQKLAGFFRQHTHDIRNDLNGLDLEAALVADIVTDPEARESVDRIRSQIRDLANRLRSLSAKFADPSPKPAPIAASELFLIWQDQAAAIEGLQITWSGGFNGEQVNVDTGAIASILEELLANARHFGTGNTLRGRGAIEADHVVFELTEPKDAMLDVSNWGQAPFNSTRRGGYGLGLWTARRHIEANGGDIRWSMNEEPLELITTVRFPAI